MSNDLKILRDRLLSRYSYDPETGIFTRLHKCRHLKPGSRAGSIKGDGYRAIGLGSGLYKEHRLAWLYVYGRWPRGLLDHINGNPIDNRICNLREASPTQNVGNSRKHRRNTSGFKGVFKNNNSQKPWMSRVQFGGKSYYLGSFKTKEEAAWAYDAAIIKFHGEFARPNFVTPQP